MKKYGIPYLEYMSRHGLDARILQEYKQCGLLYYSKRYNESSADIYRFVDFSGVDRKIIRKVDELESELNIRVYHIIWNSDKELILMYHDPELDMEYQLDKFRKHECMAIKYFTDTDEWTYQILHYEVRLGSVVDTDYDMKGE